MTEPLDAGVRGEPVVLSLGSNLDDPLAHLRRAVDDLRATSGVRVRAVSPVFCTEPVGYADQPDFLNIVVLAETDLAPEPLLARAHEIEAAHDRRRLIVNGPRTLDVDLITVADRVRTDAERPPVLPHPRAHERAFVLVPWLAVDPDATLPGHGRVDALVGELDASGVVCTDQVVS